MTVWVVQFEIPYEEGDTLEGVFSTEALAKAYVAGQPEPKYGGFRITSMAVDEDVKP